MLLQDNQSGKFQLPMPNGPDTRYIVPHSTGRHCENHVFWANHNHAAAHNCRHTAVLGHSSAFKGNIIVTPGTSDCHVYRCLLLQNLKVDTNRVMMLADGEGLFHSRLGTVQSRICQRDSMMVRFMLLRDAQCRPMAPLGLHGAQGGGGALVC
jgi:hypothetical protein